MKNEIFSTYSYITEEISEYQKQLDTAWKMKDAGKNETEIKAKMRMMDDIGFELTDQIMQDLQDGRRKV